MKKISAILFILAFLLSGLTVISNVQAETEVPEQVISTDTTWSASGSPYTFTGPVTVDVGAKLTIEPGVTVNIGGFYLQINGTLEAKGNSSNSILFASVGTTYDSIVFLPASLDWNETAGSGCIIEYAQINGRIAIDSASPKINASKISDNTAASDDTNIVISVSNGSAVISNNQINGAVEVKAGGSPKIIANKITGGMSLYAGSPEVSGNDISGGIVDDVISISHENAATITGNNITGKSVGVGFNMHNNSYANNSYSATISGNVIKDCQTGIGVGEGSGQILISGNTIFDTTTAIKVANVSAQVGVELNLIMNNNYGIDVGAQMGIQRNTIYNNTVGIYYQTTTTSAINHNNIMNNTKYNIELTNISPSVIDATYNYWGTLNITFIDETIYESNDNATLGEVVFLPALSAPGADAPIIPGVDMTPASTPMPTVTPLPTTSPTTSPTPSQTATPTVTPHVEEGLTVVEIAIIAALIIVVVIAVVLLLRRNGGNEPSPVAAPEPQ